MANHRLHSIIALQKAARSTGEGVIHQVLRDVTRLPQMSGLSKTYKPLDEADEEKLPSEGTLVQLQAAEILAQAAEPLARLLDLTATLDAGNQNARGTVTVDGVVILADVPVSTLLTLEKRLGDLAQIVAKLPVLDPAEKWEFSTVDGCWRSEPKQTIRTKKVPRGFVKAVATDKHPAQVDTYTEDIPVGVWTRVEFSGAMPASRKRELADRVRRLTDAVKVAREEANSTEVADVRIGNQVFEYLGW